MGYKSLLLALAIAAALPLSVFAAPADIDSYRPEDAVSAASSLVIPSVVGVETRFEQPQVKDDYLYWHYLRGARPLYGLFGTGFIYKNPDYVITTAFLMSDAAYIRVLLRDGRSYRAELVGKNDDLDIAVLKVDWGPNLEPLAPQFGDSNKLRLGQPMAIVGKSPEGVDTFATAGIISAIRKEMPGEDEPTDEFLQFDAPYDLSYTGAPIVDVFGNIIGMVKGTSSAGTHINLGVPINELINIADRVISGDMKDIWFGLETQLVAEGLKQNGFAPRQFDWDGDGKAEPLDGGMWVSYVEPNSPAEIAGMRAGDIVIELNGSRIKYEFDWDSKLRGFRIGELVYVSFIRKNPLDNTWSKELAQVQILEDPESKSKNDKAAKGGKTSPKTSYHRANLGGRASR